jgi:hypothetical protein
MIFFDLVLSRYLFIWMKNAVTVEAVGFVARVFLYVDKLAMCTGKSWIALDANFFEFIMRAKSTTVPTDSARCFLSIVFAYTTSFAIYASIAMYIMFAYVYTLALYTVFFYLSVLSASTSYILAVLADILPFARVLLTEGASVTIFTVIVIPVWVIGAFSFSASTAIIFYISMLAFYGRVTLDTLVFYFKSPVLTVATKDSGITLSATCS